MDWKSIIAELMSAGVTQKEIGEQVGLKQPSVSDLARGVTAEVSWKVGEKLLALHAKQCRNGVRLAPDNASGSVELQAASAV